MTQANKSRNENNAKRTTRQPPHRELERKQAEKSKQAEQKDARVVRFSSVAFACFVYFGLGRSLWHAYYYTFWGLVVVLLLVHFTRVLWCGWSKSLCLVSLALLGCFFSHPPFTWVAAVHASQSVSYHFSPLFFWNTFTWCCRLFGKKKEGASALLVLGAPSNPFFSHLPKSHLSLFK